MVGASFSRAWEIFREDMAGWIGFSFVWMVLASVLGTIVPALGGMLTLPNVVRESSRAIGEGRAPEIPALWSTENFGEDLVTTLLYSLAQFVGMLCCCIGWPFAWILFWYTIELAADGRVAPGDAMKLSMAWSRRNLGDTILMALAGMALNTIGATVGFGIGLLFTMPITFLAWTTYWNAVKDDVYRLAIDEGINLRAEATSPVGALAVEQPFDGTLGTRPVADTHEVE